MSYLIDKSIFADNMNIMIYGDPGAGKTHLAGTAQDHPLMQNVHVLNIDGGILTLAERGDISATDIRSVDELEQELYKIAAKDEKYQGIRTIVIDNITELQTLCLEHIATTEFGNRLKKDKNYTIDEIYLEDYGKGGKQLARVLRGLRDLPMHKIYIAHRKDKLRKGTQILEESRPSLSDKLCTAVMGYMDFVWYLYVADEVEGPEGQQYVATHRYLLTQTSNNFVAKTRGMSFANRLGIVVRDPNLTDIMNIFMAKEG